MNWKSIRSFVAVVAAIFTMYLVADNHWARAADVEKGFAIVDKRFDGIEKTLKEGQLDTLSDKRFEIMKKKSMSLEDETQLNRIEGRIKRLEQELKQSEHK